MKYLDKNGKEHSSRLKAIGADIKAAMKPKPPKLMGCSPDGDKFVEPDVLVCANYPRSVTTESSRYSGNVTNIYETIDQAAVSDEIRRIATTEYSCEHITIDYTTAEIIAYGADGSIISKSKIDDRLMWGYAREALQVALETVTPDQGEIIDLSDKIIKFNQSINKVAAAASGKNCIISPQVDDEFIECCAEAVSDALRVNPYLIRAMGKDGIKVILSGVENKINEMIAPDKSPNE